MSISKSKVAIWNRALGRIGENKGIASEAEVPTNATAAACDNCYDDLLRELLEARQWKWATRQRKLSNIDTQSVDGACNGAQTQFPFSFGYLDSTQVSVLLVTNAGGATTTLVSGTNYTLTPAANGAQAYVTTIATYSASFSIRVTVTSTRNGWEHVYAMPSDCVTPICLMFEDERFEATTVEDRIEFDVMANDAGDGQILCCDVDPTDFVLLEYVAMIEYVPAFPRHFVDALAWRMAAELALVLRTDLKLNAFYMQVYQQSLSRATAQAGNIGQDTVEPDTPSLAARG